MQRTYDFVLIDGYGVFVRYFYALKFSFLQKHVENKRHACYFFLRKIFSLKKHYNPKKIIVVGEKGAAVHKSYDKSYKAERAKLHPVYQQYDEKYGFTDQFNRLKEYLRVIPFTEFFISPGDECDSVIGGMVQEIIQQSPATTLLIMTFDNDFWQLLAYPQVNLLIKNKILNHKNYERYIKLFKYVPPVSYPLYKAIKGDAVDNIKGIKGIGDKTLEKIFYTAWIEKRVLISPQDLVNFISSSMFLPLRIKQLLLKNSNIIEHNLPLVNLLNLSLLSLSGQIKIRQFVDSLFSDEIIKSPQSFENKLRLKKMLKEDGFYFKNLEHPEEMVNKE
jgi:5'-3' exonuclease